MMTQPSDLSLGASSVNGVAIQVTRLDVSGAYTDDSYLFSGFVSFKHTPSFVGGDLVQVQSASGVPTRKLRVPATLVKTELELAVCAPDTRLLEILTRGRLLVSSGTAVGYAAPETSVDPTRDIAIEIWSRAILGGQQVGYYRWLFPYAVLRLTGEILLQEGVVAPVFSGWSRPNANFGSGVDGAWANVSPTAYQYIFTTEAPAIEIPTSPLVDNVAYVDPVRITTIAPEVIVSNPDPSVQVTALGAEVLAQNGAPTINISTLGAEVLIAP